MNTRFLTATILATGLIASAPAFADMTKTTTTTIKTETVPVVEVTDNPNVEVETDTTIESHEKLGYVAYDMNKNNYLEPDEYMTYSYHVIDLNDDDVVTEEEWNSYTTVWYEPLDVERTKVEAFTSYDVDGDGDIDFTEYSEGPETYVFTSWDADGNGYIDADEYNSVVTEYRTVDENNIYVW